MPRNHDEIHDSDYELDEEDSAHDYDEGEDEEESSEDDYDCEDPCQQVLDAGILRRFKEILRNKGKNRLKMGACDVIAELAMGNQTQIRALITEEVIIPIINLLEKADAKLKTCAAATILGVLTFSNDQNICT
ncbi:importin subunit alpha-6-like isoform X3 [Lotus japonicus]|uniref:importin subunit alpha-6-like isoform X3 n=1 Tax=Lotus japonicus TaxID=34305 RepID=UPI00258C8360|nr:importin subunit alpha-6-like isoform X3 [Lotus japonicus]